MHMHNMQGALREFILGSFIASNIQAALFFVNCDILGVKIIRIDPLEPNNYLVVLRVLRRLAAVFGPLADSKSQQSFMKHAGEPPAHPPCAHPHTVSRLQE